ncbi:hypothetical protein ACFO4O_15170 [Glaciecola siphonariae]|uniref:Uncharacterized protein n=1 Tax=Glaciecola siphonariae TaxID=521012 RepID=A0ABV9M0B0_9ALTE
MFDIHKPLTDNQIFYSCQTMSFYMAFSAGLGMDDICELPTSVTMHLHQTIDIIGLA